METKAQLGDLVEMVLTAEKVGIDSSKDYPIECIKLMSTYIQ